MEAREIFELGTESSGLYYHANDKWNGVTHGQYNDAMRKLLEDWIKTCGRRKLQPDDAARFLSWIANGKCDSAEFLAKHRKEFAKVFKWRAGFNQSVVVAAEALRRNRNLTGIELKGIAQAFVNGKSSQPLNNRAAEGSRRYRDGRQERANGHGQESVTRSNVFERGDRGSARLGWRRTYRNQFMGGGQRSGA